MRERLTARVVLLDGEDRILLMKGRLPHEPTGAQFWYTVGGGLEPGEAVAEAAAREALEETGLTDVVLGPALWRDEIALPDVEGEVRLFRQTYILARTEGGALSRAGWHDYEHALTDDVRWWTLDALRLTTDTVYPIHLADLLEDAIAGRFAPEPLEIATLDGPVTPPPRLR